MKTTEEFHTELMACVKAIVAAKLDDECHDEWGEFIEPFYQKVLAGIREGLTFSNFVWPICLASGRERNSETGDYIPDGNGARVSATVAFLANDYDIDIVESQTWMLHDVILLQYTECKGSTIGIIEAIEKSCAIAREKLEAAQ